MTGRVTAISGYLTALFSGSPNRSSTIVPAAVGGGGDSQDMALASSPSQVVQQHPPPQAGPSTITGASASKDNTSAVGQTGSQNDTFMYGEELESPVKNDAPHSSNKQAKLGRSNGIASSGFYGSTGKSIDKGKGKAVDPLHKGATPRRNRDKNIFRPVRLYRCPPVDRPLYTVDNTKHIITIYATDAYSGYWPSRAQQKKAIVATSSGVGQTTQTATKDWHELVTKGSQIENTWKAKIGQGLATLLELDGDPKAWKLAELPKGYGMFVKHHYQEDNNHTFFHYIIGSTFLQTRRFQTTKEYTKHIAWLCQFGNNTRLRCQCRFCIKVFEKEGNSRTPIVQRTTENMPPAVKGVTLPTTAAAAPRKALQPPAKRARKTSLLPGGDAPHQSSAPTATSARQVEVVIPKASSPALGAIRSNESNINSASAPPAALLRPAVVSKKRARKGGVPAAVRQEPVIAIDDSENEQTHGDVLDEEAGRVGEASIEMRGTISSETITARQQREKRQIPKVNYYVPSIDEFAKIDVAQDSSTSGNGANGTGNGRPARSTRYNKSMRESLPPAPRREPLPMYNGPFIHRKRHDDLKIHHAPYREHEIVWYRLLAPFTYSADPELHIAYWPGEVLHKTPKIETHHVEMVEMEDMKGNKMRVPQPVNAQYYTYTIDLFGIESVSNVECRVEEILPFAAYAVPLALNSGKAASLLRKQERALETVDPEKEEFRDVLTTWAWARHWAIAIRTHFSPFGMFFDPETIKKMGRRRRRYLAAYNNNNNSSNGITVNGNGNKRSGIIINGKRRKTRAVKEAREKEMEREKQLIRNSRQSYQGIWFGCEKFWVGDLVRLAGNYEYGRNAVRENKKSATDADTAHLHLYRGVTRAGGEPKAQAAILEGLKLEKETEGKPAFFQITHIYREPIPAGNGEQDGDGEQGELFFDGYFYQAVKDTEQQEDDGDKWMANKSSTNLGGLQGTSDSSDTCSSDQDYIVDPVTGTKKVDLSVGHMYRRMLLPPPPAGYSFQPLKSLDGKFEEDLTATIEPWMIAGRYYHSGVLLPDKNDRMTTKLSRACNGKTFRPETQAQPTNWLVNRKVMIRASSRRATRDMQIFFSNREKQEEMDRKARERKLRNGNLVGDGEEEDCSDDDDGPLVTANRSSQNTPASGRTTTKKDLKKKQGGSKETRVSSNSAG